MSVKWTKQLIACPEIDDPPPVGCIIFMPGDIVVRRVQGGDFADDFSDILELVRHAAGHEAAQFIEPILPLCKMATAHVHGRRSRRISFVVGDVLTEDGLDYCDYMLLDVFCSDAVREMAEAAGEER